MVLPPRRRADNRQAAAASPLLAMKPPMKAPSSASWPGYIRHAYAVSAKSRRPVVKTFGLLALSEAVDRLGLAGSRGGREFPKRSCGAFPSGCKTAYRSQWQSLRGERKLCLPNARWSRGEEVPAVAKVPATPSAKWFQFLTFLPFPSPTVIDCRASR
jgi:hypothetical protein